MTRILVLDDHPGLANIIALGLNASGYSAIGFVSPAEVLEKLQPEDIFLADYHMPEITGLELARKASAQGWRGSLILMSGHPQAITEPIDHPQLTHFLTKPFDLKTLLQILHPTRQ